MLPNRKNNASFSRKLAILASLYLSSFSLFAQSSELKDTLTASWIAADRIRTAARTQTGLTHLTTSELNNGFAVFSSPDLVKTLQLLPGVSSGTELLSGLFVHGGTGDDNLFLLDGSPVYDTGHMIGLFSAFNPEIIESADFYKSGFPARYGGRLSSVTDIVTKDGDMNSPHMSFSVGLIDGRVHFEGPIVKGKTSYSIGLRRTWMDALLVPLFMYLNIDGGGEEKRLNYSFWDLNAGITHRLSTKDIIRFRFFNGMDRLRGERSSEIVSGMHNGKDSYDGILNWGSTTAGLTWDRSISNKLSFRVGTYYSNNLSSVAFGGRFYYWKDDTGGGYSHVQESNSSSVHSTRVGAELDWRSSRLHHVQLGASFQHMLFGPKRKYEEWMEPSRDDKSLIVESDSHYNAGELSGYIEDEITLLPGFGVNLGLRAVLYPLKERVYSSVEPRLAARYDVTDELSLRCSYVMVSQFEHRVYTTFLDLPTNFWLPSTASIEPMRSSQWAGGLYSSLSNGIHFNVEGFWKSMDHIYEYSGPIAIFPPVDMWESSFTEGQGRSYGAEFEFGWKTSDTDLMLAYTLSWSERFFREFSSRWFPDRNDNRHKINISATYKVSSRFDVYGGWVYHSGSRMSVSTQGLYVATVGSSNKTTEYFNPVFDGPNNIKLPDYHRLDLGMNFRKDRHDGKLRIWNISLYNVYSRMNTIYAEVRSIDGKYVGKSYGFIPIIPTFSYTLKF